MKKLDILMLEDNEDDAFLILSTLQQSELKFNHIHVTNQFEFLEQLKEYEPDIILSDYGLTSYNGLAALRDKREHGVNCPFILVTGSLPDDIAVECLKAGVDDYILKDRLSRLPDAIRQVMDRQYSEEERRRVFNDFIKSQRRLEAAERMANVGNWEWKIGSESVIWSDQMYAIAGADRSTFEPEIGTFAELVVPEMKQECLALLDQLKGGFQIQAEHRFRIVNLNGQQLDIRCLFRNNGKTADSGELKVFGTVQDITELSRTEKQLRELTEELEQRVEQRTKELHLANDLLRRKNEEMTDSINYAKLIQKALLAKLDECRKVFPKSFVLLKPRDIVSGDFYWHYHNGDYDYIAAVDCTGHGVPGAFMSMIGHQLLNQVVIRKGLREPQEILEELDRNVVDALHDQTGLGVKDGMDLVFCRIDRAERTVCFAGALRPLFHVSKDGLEEYPGSRHSVGQITMGNTDETFTQQCFKYAEGDTIYLTSDGYYSQFGGPSGKKLMKSRFKQLIAKIGRQPIDEQYNRLLDFLEKWQGDEEQVDDIMVIGIQF